MIKWYKIDMGVSFCYVNKIKFDINGIFCIVFGILKWNEESLSFIMRIIVIIKDVVGLKFFIIVNWLEYFNLIMIVVMKSIDVVICVRKYLVDIFMDFRLLFLIRIGIMVNYIYFKINFGY